MTGSPPPPGYPVRGGPLDGAAVPPGRVRNGKARLPARSRNYRWTDKSTVDCVWEVCAEGRHEAVFLYALDPKGGGKLTWVPTGVT